MEVFPALGQRGGGGTKKEPFKFVKQIIPPKTPNSQRHVKETVETTGDKGRQRQTKGGKEHSNPVRRETKGDKGRQRETTRDKERQRETKRDKGRQRETKGDKGRQRETKGDKGRQRETKGDKGRQRETRRPGTGNSPQNVGNP